MSTPSVSADAAQHAGGSSFYLAMRILPRTKRDAMFEIYKFCRKVDDVADSAGPRDARLAEHAGRLRQCGDHQRLDISTRGDENEEAAEERARGDACMRAKAYDWENDRHAGEREDQ